MRHLVLQGPRHLVWEDTADPEPPGELAALVRPIATATCDFDHLLYAGSMPLPTPISIGHETVAVVTDRGSSVSSVEVGDVVMLPFQISCGVCRTCTRGSTSSCERVPWLSCYGLGAIAGDHGGCMADAVSVPFADAMLIPAPRGLDPASLAAMSCNLPDAYRAVGPQLAEQPGSPVLIASGAFDNIALYATQLALALGAECVDFLTTAEHTAAKAADLGARVLTATAQISADGYPITVDASQDPARLAAVLHATAPAGVATITTMYPAPLTEIPLMKMFERCARVETGQPHARATMPAVIELAAAGRFDLGAVVDAIVSWEDAPDAFSRGHGKVTCVRSASG